MGPEAGSWYYDEAGQEEGWSPHVEVGQIVTFSAHESECHEYGNVGKIYYLGADRVYACVSPEDAVLDGLDLGLIDGYLPDEPE